MRVNSTKTQLLCVSANNTSDVSSYIKHGANKITSGEELKILGFKFGRSPTVKVHVEYMLQKARRKLWTLRHVRRAGLCEEDMLQIFNTVVRPVVEYAVPTYHPMLTGEMRDAIESIQKRASKIIFGWNADYDELVKSGRIETLQARRDKLTLNFARKASKDERFKHWFPERNMNGVELRNVKKYKETFARTDRLWKSPIFHMRRLLNSD